MPRCWLTAKAAGTSRVPHLRIREVRAIRLRNGFNSRFVRVYTEEGSTGHRRVRGFRRHLNTSSTNNFQRDAVKGLRSPRHSRYPG